MYEVHHGTKVKQKLITEAPHLWSQSSWV